MLDRDFYLRRAAQEREMSLCAITRAAADAHRQLEAAYRDKLNGSTAVPKRRASVTEAVDSLRASGLWSEPTE